MKPPSDNLTFGVNGLSKGNGKELESILNNSADNKKQ